MRVTVNTVFGVVGLLDVATEMNLTRHREDFGQTLGRWGFPAGPYVVLPFFGPSTVRDTLAMPVDWAGSPMSAVGDVASRNALITLDLVDGRARLLDVSSMLEEASLDSYSFVRDVFLQRRNNDVHDGNVPVEGP
jgi:phospholipid-binding lipoprotein MlaA